MKFIIDAQLPLRLKKWLNSIEVDAIHTEDLPLKELTPDIDIIKLAGLQKRIIITKDNDFFKYNLIHNIPEKILIISTGNITNKNLIALFEANFKFIYSLFEDKNSIVELNNTSIIVHK